MGTAWNFRGATMAPLCSLTGLIGLVPKGRWWFCRMNRCYARNLGSPIRTKLEIPIELKHPGSPHPKKVRPIQCAVKVMFIVAYAIDGVILHHAVPSRQTINTAYYCMFLQQHLRATLRGKRQNPIILHDYARSHTTVAVTDLLRRWQWKILEHPPYSPDESMRLQSLRQSEEPLRGTRNNRDELMTRWWCTTLSKHLAKGDK